MKARCVNNEAIDSSRVTPRTWLTVNKEYTVLGIYGTADQVSYRVIADDGTTPGIFDAKHFELSQSMIPAGWVFQFVGEKWSIEPKLFATERFWERFFDGEADARAVFMKIVPQEEA